ncbi:TolC family protein, partial [Pseudomonas sp.]|uniref:TolC family protein n=1 Tax=Pseudomonas sp. TaxID=306 RepID=UPI00258A3863
MNKVPFALIPLLALLAACSQTPAPQSDIVPPPHWESPIARQPTYFGPWWTSFNSPQLSQLVEQARQGSYDLKAATARVRQAGADVRIAGGALLPQVNASADAYRQRLLRG